MCAEGSAQVWLETEEVSTSPRSRVTPQRPSPKGRRLALHLHSAADSLCDLGPQFSLSVKG